LTSATFAVVVIADELQAGQVAGVFAVSLALAWAPMLRRESDVTRSAIDLPHDFPCGYFHLRGHGDLMQARHTRRAPASELLRTKTSQHCELERGEFNGTLYHREPSFRDPICD
jgi:hypothetical protein